MDVRAVPNPLMERQFNFHVPLPDSLYNALKLASVETRRTRTDIAREAIIMWLAELERHRVDREIEAYARAMAGSPADLDPDLEAAGVSHLLCGGPYIKSLRGPNSPMNVFTY